METCSVFLHQDPFSHLNVFENHLCCRLNLYFIFLLLSSVPFYEYNTICLSIVLLIDTSLVSKFWPIDSLEQVFLWIIFISSW